MASTPTTHRPATRRLRGSCWPSPRRTSPTCARARSAHVALAMELVQQRSPVSPSSDRRSSRRSTGDEVEEAPREDRSAGRHRCPVGSTGLAAAGVLPDAAQDAFSHVLDKVGITVPAGSDHPASSGERALGDRHHDRRARCRQGRRDLIRRQRRQEPGRAARRTRLGCGRRKSWCSGGARADQSGARATRRRYGYRGGGRARCERPDDF